MTASEASADLEQLFGYVRTFYGPYEYKEARFGYSIADLEEQARDMLADEPTDDGFYTAANWFLSRFDDGHVGLTAAPSSNPVTGYNIPIFITPVENKALVAAVGTALDGLGVAYGDEVVAVDGVDPFTLAETQVRKLDGFGNPLTNQHLIYRALLRPGFAAGLRPTSPTAHIEFRRADGSEYALDLIWREVRDESPTFVPEGPSLLEPESYLATRALAINASAQGSLLELGSPTPFFYNAVTSSVFDITPVTPNAAMLARYGVDPAAVPAIFSALYSFAGKTLLLIRQAGYGDGSELAYYRAVLDQYENFVDGLVIDQTHNPGGSIQYCTDFARLFMSETGQNFVQAYNADRKWVNDLRDAVDAADPDLTTEDA
ncbi:MAG TPA: S41 family peptidase, partial [Polyangiaceae bacterium]|nr:S41 family peptidase [Polyangiaceae bacterium]